MALVQQNMISYISAYHPTRTPLYRTSSRGTRCFVQQVYCALFQGSRQSPLPAMLVVEGVVAGVTAFCGEVVDTDGEVRQVKPFILTTLKNRHILCTRYSVLI